MNRMRLTTYYIRTRIRLSFVTQARRLLRLRRFRASGAQQRNRRLLTRTSHPVRLRRTQRRQNHKRITTRMHRVQQGQRIRNPLPIAFSLTRCFKKFQTQYRRWYVSLHLKRFTLANGQRLARRAPTTQRNRHFTILTRILTRDLNRNTATLFTRNGRTTNARRRRNTR